TGRVCDLGRGSCYEYGRHDAKGDLSNGPTVFELALGGRRHLLPGKRNGYLQVQRWMLRPREDLMPSTPVGLPPCLRQRAVWLPGMCADLEEVIQMSPKWTLCVWVAGL